MADSQLEYVKDKNSAFQIWESLIETFERKGVASQLLARKKLLTMKFDAIRDTLLNHYLTFDKLVRELKSSSTKLEETDVVCHLLLTMPREYEHAVTAIETLSADKLDLGFVKSRLLDEEAKRIDGKKKIKPDSESPSVFVSQGNNYTKSQYTNDGKIIYTCHDCGEVGHKRADSTNKKKKFASKQQSSAHFATQGDKAVADRQYLCSEHYECRRCLHGFLP